MLRFRHRGGLWVLGVTSSNRNGSTLAQAGVPRIVTAGSVDGISDHIGEQLREAREAAGWVVEDIVFQTRIPRSVVVALEAGDFSVFSSSTYARSFLSQYSGFLKVDAQLWIDALEPISYASGDIQLGPWEPGQFQRNLKPAERESSGGWIAAAGTLALSCVLIYAGIRGFEYLDLRFGGEAAPLDVKRVDAGEPGSPPPSVTSVPNVPGMVQEPGERSIAGLPEEGFVEPPPRATIVRDDP